MKLTESLPEFLLKSILLYFFFMKPSSVSNQPDFLNCAINRGTSIRSAAETKRFPVT